VLLKPGLHAQGVFSCGPPLLLGAGLLLTCVQLQQSSSLTHQKAGLVLLPTHAHLVAPA